MLVIEYAIDAEDRIAAVGPGWQAFANHNDAPELATPDPARTLWSYISGDDLTSLWRTLVDRARSTTEPLSVTCRCDSPEVMRWLTITLSAAPSGEVGFRSVVLDSELRPRVAVLDRFHARDPGLAPLVVCSWCGRCLDGAEWVGVERYVNVHGLLGDRPAPPLSHGICPRCRAVAFDDV